MFEIMGHAAVPSVRGSEFYPNDQRMSLAKSK